MKHAIALALLLCVLPSVSNAQDALMVDGEPFTKRFVGHPPHNDKLIEFVRRQESFEHWTKLIGLRAQHLPGLHNDPVSTALAMARTVKAFNPKAQMRIIANKDKSEAIIDFLTWPPNGKFLEFDVFRYVRSRDGQAVLSLQLAYRFTDMTKQGMQRFLKRFQKIRPSWINQAAAFDMGMVRAALSQ